jgi:D-sedoheptulose 7-phosphate isomerase
MEYVIQYLDEVKQILNQIDRSKIIQLVRLLSELRDGEGRLFFLGVGGGAGNASHAVNDFRKITGIEAYAPTDNVSELTARVNDEGWETAYENWLQISRLNAKDMVFVFSVGGGNLEKNISVNLVNALKYGKEVKAKICGIVGCDGGYTAEVADVCIIIPVINRLTITPHTEAFQSILWHLLVSHPDLQVSQMKWESVK